ncbi:MAG: hypothetical protein QM236_05300 [Bacillota bacterium]|nr:hypothetical protein [Bacillota bacterium]
MKGKSGGEQEYRSQAKPIGTDKWLGQMIAGMLPFAGHCGGSKVWRLCG